MKRRISLVLQLMQLVLAVLASAGAHAATGVLIPRDRQTPDPSILSLEEMKIDVAIDDGDARVFITEIFLNHTADIQEGTYNLALPGGSTVSDFAVWDGAVRIPAVILERRRAEEVYRGARLQAIDPGLLQMGERDSETPGQDAIFSAKIVPIPAFGTKRLEIEYHQRIDTSAYASGFVLPLKPDAAGQQCVHTFSAHLRLHSAQPLMNVHLNAGYRYKILNQGAHTLTADLNEENLSLTEDVALDWEVASASADTLAVITHRDPTPPAPSATDVAPPPAEPELGFFQATMLVGAGLSSGAAQPVKPPRTVIVLFDNSLSMQWDKLERSFIAAEAVLRSLHPGDRFNVLLFNDKVAMLSPTPLDADPAEIERALDFIRSSRLRGGTDIGHALTAGLAQCTGAQDSSSLVLISDGNADRGDTILPGRIASEYTNQWRALSHQPHTDVFAVGDDANVGLLKLLARRGGVLERVLSTEPIQLHIRSFLARIQSNPIDRLMMDEQPSAAIRLVYPLQESAYPGSTASWVGQYTIPSNVSFSVHRIRDGEPFSAATRVSLPVTELDHPQLPRLWAQARVDALLDQINRDGETTAAIDEIIHLARRYKFVTPYTSFLAVPRSLLRPRVIRPGDPVLRVRTDPAIRSVIAIFPFGLTKPLRHLASEDAPDRNGSSGGLLWETRFLAPAGMTDGTYSVRLILRDTSGNTYREAKTFVIASTPPTVKILLLPQRLRRGEAVPLRVTASASTRTLVARLDGVEPVALRWTASANANTGMLIVPPDMPLGTWKLTVTAEDVAHNIGTAEVSVNVVP